MQKLLLRIIDLQRRCKETSHLVIVWMNLANKCKTFPDIKGSEENNLGCFQSYYSDKSSKISHDKQFRENTFPLVYSNICTTFTTSQEQQLCNHIEIEHELTILVRQHLVFFNRSLGCNWRCDQNFKIKFYRYCIS